MSRRIAIYLTDTWRDERVAGFDSYAQKFERLLGPHMPDTTFHHFDVVEGSFPDDPTEFDGVVITGSSANVTDTLPWLDELLNHIRQIDQAKTKLFAVCFGHQAVAAALGGVVDYRDALLGAPVMDVLAQRPWMTPHLAAPRIFAGNFQQVISLPENMTVLGSNPACPIAMAEKGDHILSLQFHPELSAAYMLNYIACAEDHVTEKVATTASRQIENGADGDVIGQWAANFLQS